MKYRVILRFSNGEYATVEDVTGATISDSRIRLQQQGPGGRMVVLEYMDVVEYELKRQNDEHPG